MQQPQNDKHAVKTVDFSSFVDGSAKQHVSDAMLSSLKSIGFVYLTNYGFPDETVQNMFNWVRLTGNPVLLRLIMAELVVEAIFLTTFGSQAARASSAIRNSSSR
jgi:hypothetical protein